MSVNENKEGDTTCLQEACFALGCDCCHGGSSPWDGKLDELLPDEKRSCTDIPFCALLLIIFIVQSVIFDICRSGREADPSWLIKGRDINGNTCDHRTYWPDPANYGIRMCAEESDNGCAITQQSSKVIWGSDGLGALSTTCGYETEEYVEMWCLPTSDSNVDISGLGSVQDSLNKAFGDIMTTKNFLIISAFVALVVGFLYAELLQRYAYCIVWCSIAFSVLGGFFIGYGMMSKAQYVQDSGYDNAANAMWGLGAVLVFCSLLFMIALFFMRKAINLACEVVEQAATAFTQMKSLVLFPALVFVMLIGYFAFWFIIAIYIASVEKDSTEDLPTAAGCGNGQSVADKLGQTTYKVYEFDNEFENYAWFHLFCGFWTVQFILYWSYAVVSGVFAEWYFSEFQDDGENKILQDGSPLWRSMWRISRYHTGTVAFGALIIAVIRMIRAVLVYMETKMMEYDNCMAKCIVCCVHCCLNCMECCLDKLSKDGFVFTTIFGTPFCKSAIMAFDMIWNNLANVAALTVVSDYVEFVGKISVSMVTTGLMLFIIDSYYGEDEISSYLIIALALMAITYLSALVFMHIFDVAIETLFLCYVIDIEANKVAKHASANFQNMIDSHKQDNAEEAERIKALHEGRKVKEVSAGDGPSTTERTPERSDAVL